MLYINKLLLVLLVFPLLGVFFLFFIPSANKKALKLFSFSISCITFILSLFLWIFFDKSTGTLQFVTKINWLPTLNINFVIGIDGISLFFILLTTLLIPICLLNSWDVIKKNLKEFLMLFLFLEFVLIGTFSILDLLLFYIFFESILVPMFLIIGIWGSRERKIKAAYYFFFYTFLGSVFMLLSILYIFYQVGTTNYEILLTFSFSLVEQKILWICFFIAFATKIPILPFHLWLPEAHVESPTSGSIILAGILLKLGIYGFVRFSFPFFPEACFYFSPFVCSIALISIIYSSFTAIRQTDFKKIIAYTSIAHMNLVVIGLFSFTTLGIEGAILQSLSHGFVSSALFLLIGVIYDRHHTRIIKYFGGLVHTMPLFVTVFFFFTLSNIAFPGTGNFVGELMILLGAYKINTSIAILSGTSIMIGGCYSLWLFNRIAFGNLKTQYFTAYLDLNKKEFFVFLPLIFGTLIIGIFPYIFLEPIHMSVNKLLELMYFF